MEIVLTNRFKKDVKICKKRGYEIKKLEELILLLVERTELPTHYKNHGLIGEWTGCCDAHIEPDWVLIYEYAEDTLKLWRTGSHSDLF